MIQIGLDAPACKQAWAEGETRQQNARKARARTHHDQGDGSTQSWYNVRGRSAELAVEHWLGLPLIPDISWRQERQRRHFDTTPPWCVQVKAIGSPNGTLNVDLPPKRDCWTCPYILVYSPDICMHVLIGWATGPEVRQYGYQVRWPGGGKSICLPQKFLHPMPGPTILHARMFHQGAHSICPAGRRL